MANITFTGAKGTVHTMSEEAAKKSIAAHWKTTDPTAYKNVSIMLSKLPGYNPQTTLGPRGAQPTATTAKASTSAASTVSPDWFQTPVGYGLNPWGMGGDLASYYDAVRREIDPTPRMVARGGDNMGYDLSTPNYPTIKAVLQGQGVDVSNMTDAQLADRAIQFLSDQAWWSSPEAAQIAAAGVQRGNQDQNATLNSLAPLIFAAGVGGLGMLGSGGATAATEALGSGISANAGGVTGLTAGANGATGLTGTIQGLGTMGANGVITTAGLAGSGLTGGMLGSVTASDAASAATQAANAATGSTQAANAATQAATQGANAATGVTQAAQAAGAGASALGSIGGTGTAALTAADTAAGLLPAAQLPAGMTQGMLGQIASALGITSDQALRLGSGVLSSIGGLLQGNAAQDAAQTSADAQIRAAQIAAEAAKFRPVGVSTRFGQSKFTTDANGNVTSAGYDVNPQVAAMRESLMGVAPGMLSQFTGSQAATSPMGTAAQRSMSLGNQYLATDPIAQAQKYYNDQQAVMAAQRERNLSQTLAGEFNRGTYGLSTGGTSTGMMGSNPRLEALYNAQRQQDLELAAQATQGGMDYAKFGAGMVGTGGDLLKSMYGTQSASYAPYQTAMSGATMLEGLGQNALDLSMNLGKNTSNAQAGQLLSSGMMGAAQTMQPANSFSPWGSLLSGAGNSLSQFAGNQQPQGSSWYDPTKFRLTPIG